MPLAQSDGSPDTSRQECPAGQLVHSVEPLTEEYVPVPQAVQVVEPPREDVPAGHADGSCVVVKLWYGSVVVFVWDDQATRFGIICFTVSVRLRLGGFCSNKAHRIEHKKVKYGIVCAGPRVTQVAW